MLQAGMCLPLSTRVGEYAADAERLGYDFVATGEHLAFHGPTTNAFISLSMAAACTDRVGLLSTITLLPLYPPALAAKLAATLDHLSGGRFNLGVGVGGEYPKEFEAVGVPVEERGPRADEALTVIRQLLDGQPVSFDGRFTSFDDVRISPPPKRRVPVWVAGRRKAAMRRAAIYGDVWMPYMYTPEQVRSSADEIQQLRHAHNGTQWEGETALYVFTSAYSDGDRARAVAVDYVSRTYKQDFETIGDRYLLYGDPARCRERLLEYLDAGVSTVIFRLACPRDDLDEMARLVSEEIVAPLR